MAGVPKMDHQVNFPRVATKARRHEDQSCSSCFRAFVAPEPDSSSFLRGGTVVTSGGSAAYVPLPWWQRFRIDLRSDLRLHDSNVVAEWIAQPDVDAVGLLHRFLSELDALGEQRLIGLSAVVRREADRETRCALRNELADLPSGRIVHLRWTRSLEQDVASRLSRHANGQPAHESEILIAADLQAELADVEVQRFVLIGDEDVRDGDGVQHVSRSSRFGSYSNVPSDERASPKLLRDLVNAALTTTAFFRRLRQEG